MPDLNCEAQNLLIDDLKQKVPDLGSGGISSNLTPGYERYSSSVNNRTIRSYVISVDGKFDLHLTKQSHFPHPRDFCENARDFPETRGV